MRNWGTKNEWLVQGHAGSLSGLGIKSTCPESPATVVSLNKQDHPSVFCCFVHAVHLSNGISILTREGVVHEHSLVIWYDRLVSLLGRHAFNNRVHLLVSSSTFALGRLNVWCWLVWRKCYWASNTAFFGEELGEGILEEKQLWRISFHPKKK